MLERLCCARCPPYFGRCSCRITALYRRFSAAPWTAEALASPPLGGQRGGAAAVWLSLCTADWLLHRAGMTVRISSPGIAGMVAALIAAVSAADSRLLSGTARPSHLLGITRVGAISDMRAGNGTRLLYALYTVSCAVISMCATFVPLCIIAQYAGCSTLLLCSTVALRCAHGCALRWWHWAVR
jgi:hypothetical protein